MVSIPEGCNISSVCNLFVGISTNEDNSSFFDFYIEGDANGWVAVGFSESRNMVGGLRGDTDSLPLTSIYHRLHPEA